MRIIFAGTPEFAAHCLKTLIAAKHSIIAVYTQPDKPAGRGQKLTASAVKQVATAHALPIHQPITLRDPMEQQLLQDLKPDLMVVVAYGLLLPAQVLKIPTFGCINVHPSLLPLWRGAAPIQRSILSGADTTGVTIMQMEEGLDTGPMLSRVVCPIMAEDTTITLQQKLAQLGSELLVTTIKEFATDSTTPEIQDKSKACYAHKLTKQEAELDWNQNAFELDRRVRAFQPWPVAYTYFDKQVIKIWQSIPLAESSKSPPGTLINIGKAGLDVATGDGVLRLLQIQLPNHRCLSVADILNSKADWFKAGTKFGEHSIKT